MTPEKEKRIFEVYGVTSEWKANDGHPEGMIWPSVFMNGYSVDMDTKEASLVEKLPSMLIMLWRVYEVLSPPMRNKNGALCYEIMEFLSSRHPEKLPFEEIERRVGL